MSRPRLRNFYSADFTSIKRERKDDNSLYRWSRDDTLGSEMCVKKKRERDGKGEDDYCEIGESERGRYKRGGNFN